MCAGWLQYYGYGWVDYDYCYSDPEVLLLTVGTKAYSTASQLQESTRTWSWYDYASVPPANTYSSLTVQQYQPDSPMSCVEPTALPFANTITPSPVVPPTCDGIDSGVAVGDSNVYDYVNNAEGNQIAANMLYTTTFTGYAGWTLSAVGVNVFNNSGSSINLHMGLYDSSSGQLLAQTGPVNLLQVTDQQIVMPLLQPAAISTTGQYLLALLSDSPLALPTATTQSPTMASAFSTASLPANFTASGNGGSLPLVAFGCSMVTHSFCAFTQYYLSFGSEADTFTYQYTGLLSAYGSGSNANGNYLQVNGASGYMTEWYTYTSDYPGETGFDGQYPISLSTTGAGPGMNLLYPGNSVAPLDSNGLSLSFLYSDYGYSYSWTSSLGFVNGSFSDGNSLNWGMQPINSGFTLSTVGTTGILVPSCSLSSMTRLTVPAAPAAPTCPAGQTLQWIGDTDSGDYQEDYERGDYFEANAIQLYQFTSPANASWIYQIAVGVLVNLNTVVHARFAVYDGQLNLVATTDELLVVNTADQQLTMSLPGPAALQPASTYYLALWMDAAVWMAFTFSEQYCSFIPYPSSGSNASWPSPFPSTVCYDSQTNPMGAYLCVSSLAPPPGTTSGSGSTGGVSSSWSSSASSSIVGSISSSGSSGSSSAQCSSSGSSSSGGPLSTGAIVGVVLGCVIGSNLLLLTCFLLCFSGRGKSGSHSQPTRLQSPEPSVTGSPDMVPQHTAGEQQAELEMAGNY